MLLHELRKATHAAHPDYGLLEVAVEEIEKVANHVNEQKRDAENRARVNDVRLRCEPGSSLLLSLRRDPIDTRDQRAIGTHLRHTHPQSVDISSPQFVLTRLRVGCGGWLASG
eukprot:COSAG04_NODE_12828_length_633_cov_0.769663_2_plen_113_part_00